MTDSSSSTRALPELPPSSRYELLFKLASGGMASVYVGRLRGAGGFWRLVAIKKAHAHLLEDRSFRRMLVEEARLASRIHHSNVVSVLDVEQLDDQLLLVMDYIEGASLADIVAARSSDPSRASQLPPRLAVRIALDACAGLQAAHELTDASGKPLHIVHRDVSPQNLLVGIDGVARLADFGIAKSAQQGSTTTTGALKGKLAYMAPEYVDGKPPDARSDVFGLGVVIWEALANRRLFRGDSEVDTLKRVVQAEAPLLSTVVPGIGTDLDPVLAAALAKNPDERFASARALGTALEIAARRASLVASAEEVGAYVRALFEAPLAERRRLIQERVASDPGPASARPTVPTAPRSNADHAASSPLAPAPFPISSPRHQATASASASAAGSDLIASPRAVPANLAAGSSLPGSPSPMAPSLAGGSDHLASPSALAGSPSVPAKPPRHLAATVHDEGAAAPARPFASAAQFASGESSLEGSDMSRRGPDSLAPSPPRARRIPWLLAGSALLAGALLAILFGQWTTSSPSSSATSPVAATSTPVPATIAVDAPPPTLPSTAPSPTSSLSASTSARAPAPPPIAGSARKPNAATRPSSAATAGAAPESIPPNPYGTKP